jgi:molecular chaperone Hsp33
VPAQHDDRLTPFVFERAALRGALVRLDTTAASILAGHDYPPPIARALCELLAASALLASTLKLDGSMIVQLRGEGPLRLLVVECDGNLDLRATAQWSAADVAALGPDASLRALAGSGEARLAITLDPRGAGNLYQGIVTLKTESIAASIEHYLETSEQLPSRLVLATRAELTRGLLLQRLPESAPGDAATWVEATRHLSEARPSLLDAPDDTALLRALFPDDDLRVFPARAARFACKCSLARAANALRIAGRGEVEAALAGSGHVEVTCEYCGRRYTFDPPAARALFEPGAQARRPG